jgi:hypothetical protein
MTSPTDEKLIVQGPSRGGVREVGGVIEERVHVADGLRLGHSARTCLTCHKPWIGPAVCGQNGCHGIEFEERDITVTPMVIESMPAPNKASATALLSRQVKVEVQSVSDVALLVNLREQLEQTVQELLVVDETMHRIVGRSPVDMAALFQEAKTPREIAERDGRLADVNREIWYGLQSAVHFAAETSGDIPLGGNVPFNASLVLQCRHVVAEIDRALLKYADAQKEKK